MNTSTALHYETAEHVLCSADTPGARGFIAGGLQPDGTYRYMFDLDSHTAGQNADDLLAYGHQRAAAVLDKCIIVPTKRKGHHITIRYHRALNPGNIYDPRTGQHAGELLQERTDPIDAPLLTTMELLDLLRAFHVPGVFQQDDDQAPAELRGESTTARKEYLRTGRSLIVGWDRIRDWRERLDKLCAVKPMLASFRTRTRTHDNRSDAYGAFVQSLMLHAAPLGRDVGERCAMVAAMAIGIGAGGKEADKDYRIENDTAVLIAKILDGAPMRPRPDGTIPHWVVPKWHSGQQWPAPAPAPDPAPAPEPVKRPAHRPVGDRARMVKRLEKLIRRWLDDSPSGRIYYTIADIADDLGCSPRSVTNYLGDLETAGKIRRGQLSIGGRAYFDVLPPFWHANKSNEIPKPDTQADSAPHASHSAEYRAPMPDAADLVVQCIEVERAPKACAPSAVQPGGLGGAAACGPAGPQPFGAPQPASETPLALIVEPDAAYYDPALAKRARKLPKRPSKERAAAAKRRRQAKLAAMSVAELKERRRRLARRAERAKNTAQADIFDELLAEMTYILAKTAPEYDPDAYVWRNKQLQRRLTGSTAAPLPEIIPERTSRAVTVEPDPAGMIARLKADRDKRQALTS